MSDGAPVGASRSCYDNRRDIRPTNVAKLQHIYTPFCDRADFSVPESCTNTY